MKKFLLVVTLVGVVISQIFSSSVAEAYNEGDKISVSFVRCDYCHRKAIIIYGGIDGHCIRDDTDVKVSGYCPYYHFSAVPVEHRWISIEHKYYIYRNGQWVEQQY